MTAHHQFGPIDPNIPSQLLLKGNNIMGWGGRDESSDLNSSLEFSITLWLFNGSTPSQCRMLIIVSLVSHRPI